MIGLDYNLKRQIIETITSYKSVDKIVLFGSRSRLKFKQTSDIDLAIISDRWTSTDINLVKDILEEKIPTILKFDLLLYNALQKESLKNEIGKGLIIYDNRSHERIVS
jgi:predicted nucleotidyltransferase